MIYRPREEKSAAPVPGLLRGLVPLLACFVAGGQICPAASAGPYLINTRAGGAPSLLTPAPAASVSLATPAGAAVDAAGNLLIADSQLQMVVRIDRNGILTRFAGTPGIAGGGGNGGQALNAQLTNPSSLAIDANGNVYVGEFGRVRKIAPSGIITLVAGNGVAGYSGDGGQAANATLSLAAGLAADASGNLYIADYDNHRIRRVDANGIITTAVGNGTPGSGGDGDLASNAQLGSPSAVALGSSGILYIADSLTNRVRKVAANGIITTILGSTTGPNGRSYYPKNLAVTGGTLFVSDFINMRVWRIDGTEVTTAAGNGSCGFPGDFGSPTSASLCSPYGVATDSAGTLYITDGPAIRRVSGGTITTISGVGAVPSGPATVVSLTSPDSVATDQNGNVYFSEPLKNRVFMIAPGGALTTVAGTGASGFSGDGGAGTSAALSRPTSLAVDGSGNLYIADSGNGRVRRVTRSGIISTVAGGGSLQPGYSGEGGQATSASFGTIQGLAADTPGNLYIADHSQVLGDSIGTAMDRVVKVDTSGIVKTVAGGAGSGYSGDGNLGVSALLSGPRSLAVDPGRNLYIADVGNNRVRKVDPNGFITTVAGDGTPGSSGDGGQATSAAVSPWGVAVDGSGNLFLSDSTNRIRKVDSSGIITTVAGNGFPAYTGDGGQATQASLQSPAGLALDSAGNVYIADKGNHVLRVLVQAGRQPLLTIKTTHGAPQPGSNSISYTITVGNAAGAGTSMGSVTVAVQLSAGLTATAVSGSGWACSLSSCARGDSLAAGASYPPISVTALLAANASQWNAQFSVSGAGLDSGITDFVLAPGISSPAGARFVSIIPCRVADTRNGAAPFGGILTAASSRTFPIRQGACNIPATATAYSLNVTVVPAGPLGYLTAWPTGQTQPLVSTLNSPQGKIVANAALVPAGDNGGINIYATDTTHLVLDITGYFDPSNSAGLSFFVETPCRIVDTRTGLGGAPALAAGMTYTYAVRQASCGPPPAAPAVSLNATVVPKGGQLGYLTLWPSLQQQPFVSTLNSLDGRIVANAAILATGPFQGLAYGGVSAAATDPTDLVLDINGYFGPASSGTPLSFYSVTPCRVADTRLAAGSLGGPRMDSGQTRAFPVPQSACGIPPAARAYAMNVTVVPQGALGYLTVWPADQAQPLVSTLNSPLGTIVANAAIVPAASDGSIRVFVTDATDVVLDINGYFAP